MQPRPDEWNWLDASETISAAELSRACGLSDAELQELVGYGAVQPLKGQGGNMFSAGCVVTLRHACQLRQDFDLDLFTVSLLSDYLDRIEALQRELRMLRAHLPTHLHPPHREGPPPWVEPHAKAATADSFIGRR
jgi:chaperone modulatory protein CbpM